MRYQPAIWKLNPTVKIEMTYTVEQLIAIRQANLKTLERLTTRAYAGFEKLSALNVAAARAMFADTFGHAQALLGARHPQQLVSLQLALIQPLTEKSIAYGQQVSALGAESRLDIFNASEAQLLEAQNAWSDLLGNLVKNAPAGNEAVVDALKSAITASQNVIASAQRSARKAVEMAESHFTAVSKQAADAAAAVSKQR